MKALYFIFLVICLASCKQAYEVEGILVSESLAAHTYDKKYDYKELLVLSINRDKSAIKQFSTLPISDGIGYEHGAVLVDLIDFIGEKKYVQMLDGLTQEEKRIIMSFLEVGLEYGNNPRFKNKRIESAFPQLSQFFKK